jgi:hypothetical protein
MAGEKKDWAIKSADDVAQALDWLRRRMGSSGLVLIAVGVNSVAFCKDVAVSAEDAAELVAAQLPALRQGFYRIQADRVTRGFSKREDV